MVTSLKYKLSLNFRIAHGMSKYAFRKLMDLLIMDLESSTPDNPTHLPPAVKLSTFLQFMRTNSFQRAVASQKELQISQSAVCKTINHVAKALAMKQEQFVNFPDHEESLKIANKFSKEYGFPPVVHGLIDGTHVQILKPVSKDPAPEKFYNRKGYYSLNCMCVVDHTGKFRYFTARHCGSIYDAKAFGQSHLRAKLVGEFDPQSPPALVGDEGYGCEDVLLTPVRRSQIDAERDEHFRSQMIAYNKALRSLRVKVEHAFGILKKRFPVLLYQIRCRNLKHVQAIIAAAIVIHNFLIDINEPEFSSGDNNCWCFSLYTNLLYANFEWDASVTYNDVRLYFASLIEFTITNSDCS
jgi:hypothetical protein